MTIWEAAVLGVVQGVTEFLPISSSGHLVIFQQWFGLEGQILTFDVFLHLATLLAIIAFFGTSLLKLRLRDWLIILVGTIPAAVIGILFKDGIEKLFANDQWVGVELIITGLINFYIDWQLKKLPAPTTVNTEHLTLSWWQSFNIGIAQAIAIIPGISRSGSTVAGAVFFKLDRETAFRYSFLLAIPALAGAGVLEAKDALETPFTLPWINVVVGCLAAGISGFASLALFKYVMKKAHFEWFGWYSVILGSAYTLYQLWR